MITKLECMSNHANGVYHWYKINHLPFLWFLVGGTCPSAVTSAPRRTASAAEKPAAALPQQLMHRL